MNSELDKYTANIDNPIGAENIIAAVVLQYKRIVLLYEIMIFDVNMDAVGKALSDRGINYTKATSFEAVEEETTIYVTCITHEGRKLPKYYISYNWEQLTTDKGITTTIHLNSRLEPGTFHKISKRCRSLGLFTSEH